MNDFEGRLMDEHSYDTSRTGMLRAVTLGSGLMAADRLGRGQFLLGLGVLREAFRDLKPGGRFAVSDVVLCGQIRAQVRGNPQLWTGRMAGAMQEEEYKAGRIAAGFVEPSIEPTRIFRADDVREFLSAAGAGAIPFADELDGKVMSASMRADRPSIAGETSTKGHTMQIQILGTGCARCQQLTANAEEAVQGLGFQAQIEKVTEIKEILKFQILMTPGLAINGKVKSAGRVPTAKEIREMLIQEGGN
ncbi:MAG: MTH895/ArsE family thioredoxin-like protein [Acidobacteriaceae bacterium]